jgi:catechol 2,3-dioxygenase-like lactoylglutathione lyase family enzyme
VTGRPRFAHIAALVSDLDRSTRFYEQVVGWRVLFDHRFDDGTLGAANGVGGNGRIRMGEVDGVRFELVEMEAPLPPRAGRPDHLGAFLLSVSVDSVDSLDGIGKAAAAAGGEVRRTVAIGGSTLLVVADPDGQEVGIIAPGPGSP